MTRSTGSGRTGRTGATIAELAVALLLAGSAAAVGASMLVAAERRARRDAGHSLASQTTRDVLHLLGAEIAAARWGSVVVRGDSAVDLQSHVGAAVACAAVGNVVILPSARTSLVEPWSVWRHAPEPGDVLAAWDTSGAWIGAAIDSATTTSGGCAAGGPFRSLTDSVNAEPLTRLRLASAIGVGAGAPVRIFRSLRWVIYRGGDSRWWLGQRRCAPPGAPSGCGAAQPVAGPLAPPADSGLRLELLPDGGLSVLVRPAAANLRAPIVRATFTIRGSPAVSGTPHVTP